MNKQGVSLLEIIITSAILAIIIIPTVDVMSKMVIAQTDVSNDIKAKQSSITLADKISSDIRAGTYIYPKYSSLTIPTKSGSAYVINNYNTIAVLLPVFNTDGTLVSPSTNVTSFTGVAFSIITEMEWKEEGEYSKYVLIKTIFDDSTLDISVDPNDPLKVNTSPTTNWNDGTSYLISDNLKPGIFKNMEYHAFEINDPKNVITFSFVPKADGIYFPSSYGTVSVNDSSYLNSVSLRNWRDSVY